MGFLKRIFGGGEDFTASLIDETNAARPPHTAKDARAQRDAASLDPVPSGAQTPAAQIIAQAEDGIVQAQWDRVVALTHQGRKIDAIKALREFTDLGLAEAKAQVDAIADGTSGHTDVRDLLAGPAAGVPGAGAFPTGRGEQEVRRLLADNKLIDAIKLYRELHGVGLKEAKDAVERMRDGH